MAENVSLRESVVRKRMTEWLAYFDDAARRSAEYSQRHFRFLGFLTVLVPLAYVVDYVVGQPHFDTLIIRCVPFVLSIPLIFHNSKPLRSLPYFHVYFVGLVAYVLPFTFGLMLMLNAASAPPGDQIEMLWILQYFVSLFLFIQLIHNGPLATALWISSTVAAASSLVLLDVINWHELNRVMLYPISGYLTALFFGIITNRNVDYVNAEKLRAASAIGGNIAHELRTPLASIRSLARSVRRHSETLAHGYQQAADTGLDVDTLTRRQIDGLKDALATIEREVEYSNTIIDMLLINTAEHSAYAPSPEQLSIGSAINEAIERYPFNNSGERQLLTLVVRRDFEVLASRVLLVHVFFNLLKNSIYYAQGRPGGTVTIEVDALQRGCVKITDTGPGMSAMSRRRVFDRFYTTATTGQGAGIGLSFCKMVMKSLGGDIQCESREGEYTTFTLAFPTVSSVESESSLSR